MNILTPVQLGFSTSPAWYSKVIKDFTKSKVSHTFLIVSLFGVALVLEEGYHGYSMRLLADFPDKIVRIVVPKVDLRAAVRESLKDLGQPYGYPKLLGMFFVMCARRLGHKIRNPARNSRSMICSERNTRILQAAKYPGADKLDPSSTSPEDLLEFLTAT